MCNDHSPAAVPTAQGRGLTLARHLLNELHAALADLAEAERTIARLEQGYHRFICRRCSVVVWSPHSEPPPSWRPARRQAPDQTGYLCQDCAAAPGQAIPAHEPDFLGRL